MDHYTLNVKSLIDLSDQRYIIKKQNCRIFGEYNLAVFMYVFITYYVCLAHFYNKT